MRVPRTRVVLVLAAGFAVALGAVAAFAPPPNDPDFLPDPACPPGGPASPTPACQNPSGQWNLLSYWFNNAPDPGHASGISADLAWNVTVGRRDTVVVVLDSGVNYDRDDLANKIWLSCGELPAPQDAGGTTTPGSSPGCRESGLAYDLDGNGYLNVEDYANDPRVPNSVATAAKTRGDLRPFENGVDDDGNGFVDDISGWDARDGDGDEYRTTGDGHGTGRNGIIGAEGDNGIGLVGVCPECTLANVRVDATFVTRTEGPAIGALWAADHGFEVINMALGATTASSMARAAFDYFTLKNGLALNASANEFSFHQNFQTVFDDVMAIGAVAPDFDEFQGNPSPGPTTTYLRKANFSNYGAHLDVVTPTDVPTTGGGNTGGYGDSSGTSSAVPHAAGVAGLVFSRARELIDAQVLDTSGLALADISAQEVRQIINRTADDIVASDDPVGSAVYPYLPGWDRWTGYGRVNALAAVQRVAPGTIPPEADINAPDWYRKVSRDSDAVTVEFYANARWASDYDWVLEWGAGIEPASFTPIDSANGAASDPALSSASMVSNLSRIWDTTGLADGFYTLRLRVTDDLDNQGEDRMGVWIQNPDPDDHAGWPQTVAGVDGVRSTSLDSIGSALVDLDGDNTLEILVSSGDGVIHAFRHDGSELPGWPVRTDDVEPLPLAQSDAFDGDPANGEITVSSSSVVGGVSVADIDADTVQEVCASAYNGKIYCWDATGTLEPGFPVETDKGITRDQYTGADELNADGDAVLAPPALADLDGDGTFELIAGAFDQKMYIWNHDGTRYAPWPKPIFDALQTSGVNTANPRAIISVPIVADIDGDDGGMLELVFGTNETYGSTPNESGRLYAYEVDGSLESGWPVEVGPSPSAGAVPLVAQGVGTSPTAADIEGDGSLEIATGVLLSPPLIFNHDGTQFALMNSAAGGPGGSSDDTDEETSEGGLGTEPSLHYVAFGAFADLEGAGALSYLNGTVGLGIGTLAIGSGVLAPLDFHLSAWDATSGAQKAAFPRLLEDWQFFTGPAVADLSGVDGTPEIVVSSGGYYVHAFNGVTGLEAAGFPKLTGQWVVATPVIGDIDDDGDLEVVVSTRLGDLHVWDMPGATCVDETPPPGGNTRSNAQWRKALHDEWGGGYYGRDTLRPAAIADLAQPADGDLTFSGVGDDGHCGSSTTYEVRSLPGTVNPNWAAGTLEGQFAGSADGAPQAISLGAFGASATLMVRAFDEAGNGTPVAVNFPEPSRTAGLGAAVALLACLGQRRRVRRAD